MSDKEKTDAAAAPAEEKKEKPKKEKKSKPKKEPRQGTRQSSRAKYDSCLAFALCFPAIDCVFRVKFRFKVVGMFSKFLAGFDVFCGHFVSVSYLSVFKACCNVFRGEKLPEPSHEDPEKKTKKRAAPKKKKAEKAEAPAGGDAEKAAEGEPAKKKQKTSKKV